MARPRKRENQGLPQGLLCRKRKRKDGLIVTYYYYCHTDGKEQPLGKDKHNAILETARINYEKQLKPETTLFIDVAERYKIEIIPTKKAKNTINSNKQAIKRLCQFFGDPPIPLEDIEPQHIRMYLQWRKDVPATANIEIGLFNHIWNMAREWGYTRLASPSLGIKKYKTTYREIYVEDYILDKLYECADQRMKDIIDTAYLLGQRPIDVVKIHRSHIYDDILHITQQKTGKKVRFAITGKLKEIIERRLSDNSEWLFVNKWGRKLERRVLTQHFAELRKATIERYPELANEIAQVQFRDLRAKVATDISLQGSDEQAQKQLGHTTVRMTKHYIRKDKLLTPTER